MNNDFKDLSINLPKLNTDMLKNIQIQNTIPPIQKPSFPKLTTEANEDCPYTNLCEKLNIAEKNICYSGADIRHRCSFGESRNIILLSQLLNDKVQK